MSNAKHTPGPWKVSAIQSGFKITPTNDEDFKICRIENAVTYLMDFDDSAEPDARLIAAAPETAAERDRLKEVNAELLEALKAVQGFLNDDSYENADRVADIIDRAVAKAEGGAE